MLSFFCSIKRKTKKGANKKTKGENEKASNSLENSLEKSNEILILEIEKFYSSSNLGCISISDYNHRKKKFKCFDLKILGDCHDLHMRKGNLLLREIVLCDLLEF